MKACEQTPGQSILDHGLSVWEQYQKLINGDTSEMRLPQWYDAYKDQILATIHPLSIIQQYTTYHDCGKPFCLEIDADGRKHFPNHAEISQRTYEENFGREGDHGIIADLIGLDMICHTETADQIIGRNLPDRTICTLFLAALAEIHANAQMFGGIDSTSFKIKWKKLQKLGNRLCKYIFDHSYMYAITRDDLSPAQRAVQAGHAAIEASRAFISKDDEHPSLILCTLKGEDQLRRAANDLESKGIQLKRWYEPDRNNELTAIASRPIVGDDRKLFKKFQLLK